MCIFFIVSLINRLILWQEEVNHQLVQVAESQNVQFGTFGNLYLSIQDIDLTTDSIRFIRRDIGSITNIAKESNMASAQTMLGEMYGKQVDEASKPVMESFMDSYTSLR